MTGRTEVADLGIQLLVGAVFVVLMVVIHSAGLVGITRGLRLHQERSIPNEWGLRAAVLLGTYGVLLFALHFVEIFIFAAFYRWVGACSPWKPPFPIQLPVTPRSAE